MFHTQDAVSFFEYEFLFLLEWHMENIWKLEGKSFFKIYCKKKNRKLCGIHSSTCQCGCIWRAQVDFRKSSLVTSSQYFFSQGLSLNLETVTLAGLTAREPWELLCSFSQQQGNRHRLPCQWVLEIWIQVSCLCSQVHHPSRKEGDAKPMSCCLNVILIILSCIVQLPSILLTLMVIFTLN